MTSSWMTTSCTLKLVVVNDCIWKISGSHTRSFLLHKYVKISHLCCICLEDNSLTFSLSSLLFALSQYCIKGECWNV